MSGNTARRRAGQSAVGWQLEPQGTQLKFTGDIHQLLGLSTELPLERVDQLLSCLHPEQRSAVEATMQRLRRHGGVVALRCHVPSLRRQSLSEFELEITAIDLQKGPPYWLEGRFVPLDGATHEAADITQIRRRHDAAMRAAGVASWTWSLRGSLPAINPALEELFQVPAGSYDGSFATFLQYIHEADRERVKQEMTAGIDSAEGFEVRFRRSLPDGSVRWLASRGIPERRDADGAVISMAGAVWDVTAEMQAREENEAVLDIMAGAAIAAQLGFWLLDMDTGVMHWGQSCHRLTGVPVTDPAPTPKQTLQWVHPEDAGALEAAVNESLRSRTTLAHAYRFIRPDTGDIRHFMIRGGPHYNQYGQLVNFAGFIMDETDTATLRMEADRVNGLLTDTLAAIRAVAWQARPEQNSIEFMGEVRQIMGLRHDDPLPSWDAMGKLTHPEDRDSLVRSIKRVLRQGGEFDHHHRVMNRRTGQHQWFHVRGRQWRDADGKLLGLTGVSFDDTEAMQRRQEYQALRERYDTALRVANVGSWTMHIKDQRAELDPVIAELHGIDLADYDGRLETFMQYTYPDDRQEVAATLQRIMDTGEPHEVRFRRQRADGDIRWLMARAAVIEWDDDGQAVRVGGATWDVTELARLTEALEQSNRELDDFAHIASHDLREPLRGLHNYARFLQEDYADKLDEEGRSMLAALGRLSRRLDDLISELLNLSRVGRGELNLKATDMQALLEDVRHTLEYSLEQAGVELRIPQKLPVINCDRVRVGELLRNLLTNASKYNDKAEKWIEISHSDGVFHVRDNGIGIAPQHHERIFTIFKRLHAQDEFGGGTGAGLTIARQVAERHGGRLWLESTPGVGSCFHFTLGEPLQ